MPQYNSEKEVQDKLTELERRMRAVETVSRLESASVGRGGVDVSEGGAITFQDGGKLNIGDKGNLNIVGGSLHINGTGKLDVKGNAEFKSTSTFNGNTTFNGDLSITSGSLSLPQGSIDGDALSEQVEVRYGSATNGDFQITSSSWKTVVSASVATPNWKPTRAAVFMEGHGFFRADNNEWTTYYIGGNCAGSSVPASGATLEETSTGTWGAVGQASWSNNVSNPSGNITCSVSGRAGGTPHPYGNSWARIEMLVIFMR